VNNIKQKPGSEYHHKFITSYVPTNQKATKGFCKKTMQDEKNSGNKKKACWIAPTSLPLSPETKHKRTYLTCYNSI